VSGGGGGSDLQNGSGPDGMMETITSERLRNLDASQYIRIMIARKMRYAGNS
jgi:hypothetical protein